MGILRRPPAFRLIFALPAAVCLSAVVVMSAPLSAQESGEAGADTREQALEEIGQNWVDRIQGREAGDSTQNSNENPGENPNGERIGPAPENAETAADTENADAPGGPLRLRNPGAADAPAAGGAGDGETLGVLPRTDDGPSLFSVIFRFFGLMALMVGLFYLGMRYLRAKTGAPVMGGGDLVQVLVSVPLVQGKFLQIVDVAGRLMVLGVSDSGVQMLETIDDGVVADRVRIWQSRRAVNGPLPTSLLDQLQNVFKTSDFRFWVSGDDRGRSGAGTRPARQSFGDLLRGQVPVAAGAAAGPTASAVGSAFEPEAAPDLFADAQEELPLERRPAGGRRQPAAAVDVPEDQVPDEIALKNLLKQQKRRLAGAKRKPRGDS